MKPGSQPPQLISHSYPLKLSITRKHVYYAIKHYECYEISSANLGVFEPKNSGAVVLRKCVRARLYYSRSYCVTFPLQYNPVALSFCTPKFRSDHSTSTVLPIARSICTNLSLLIKGIKGIRLYSDVTLRCKVEQEIKKLHWGNVFSHQPTLAPLPLLSPSTFPCTLKGPSPLPESSGGRRMRPRRYSFPHGRLLSYCVGSTLQEKVTG